MNEELQKSQWPEVGDEDKSAGRNSEAADRHSNAAAPPSSPEATAPPHTSYAKQPVDADKSTDLRIPGHYSGLGVVRAKGSGGEPSTDWLEPLEEDEEDADRWMYHGRDLLMNGKRDADEESLAGESVTSDGQPRIHNPRRRRAPNDEGWMDWPVLGDGWKRKEVVRRSGWSVGQKDVYYMSPQGERVRSRVELLSLLEEALDMSAFDFKSGTFLDGAAPPPRTRGVKRKMRERSSSESSLNDGEDGADSPDSLPSLTPTLVQTHVVTPNRGPQSFDSAPNNTIKLPHIFTSSTTTSTRPLPSINGDIGTEENALTCAKCCVSFIGTSYDRQRKRPCCPNCWAASKTKEHPMIRFRKWIPCGQCVACRNTENCGQCANCKHGQQSREVRKRVCRKRKCICPIRKQNRTNTLQRNAVKDVEIEDRIPMQSEITETQLPSHKSSDRENFTVTVDVDDEDEPSTDNDDDEDDDWHRKRKRRSCGKCNACLCRKDCGMCDFCFDKPKFGGNNKKRQKCRLRQCQRQAMMSQPDFGPCDGGTAVPERQKPHYTYSRKSTFKRSSLDPWDNDEDEDSIMQSSNCSLDAASGSRSDDRNLPKPQSSQQTIHIDLPKGNGLPVSGPSVSDPERSPKKQRRKRNGERLVTSREGKDGSEDEKYFPTISKIFSLAENSDVANPALCSDLVKLLEGLRASALPILWYAIMVEGPQLLLIQCSKHSNMADTMVRIDPGFSYQVTVQQQPLLLTHQLYDEHPPRLSNVTDVVKLLLDLEKYYLCQGLPPEEPPSSKLPIILDRASTCDFLVRKNVDICTNCRRLCR